MGRSGIEVPFHLFEHVGELLQGDLRPDHVQQLHETAHVSPLVLVGQVHVHVDVGHGMLDGVGPVEHGDGVSQVLDPDFVDGDVAVVSLVLDVFHRHPQAPRAASMTTSAGSRC